LVGSDRLECDDCFGRFVVGQSNGGAQSWKPKQLQRGVGGIVFLQFIRYRTSALGVPGPRHGERRLHLYISSGSECQRRCSFTERLGGIAELGFPQSAVRLPQAGCFLGIGAHGGVDSSPGKVARRGQALL
jgi:hypothetical protein